MQDIAAGARERNEEEWERAAWVTAYLLQPHARKGRKITPRQLLGRGFYSHQEKEAAFKKWSEAQDRKVAQRESR